MTGPVSGSFIHWVLFKGFSSMSSNAARRKSCEKQTLPCSMLYVLLWSQFFPQTLLQTDVDVALLRHTKCSVLDKSLV